MAGGNTRKKAMRHALWDDDDDDDDDQIDETGEMGAGIPLRQRNVSQRRPVSRVTGRIPPFTYCSSTLTNSRVGPGHV